MEVVMFNSCSVARLARTNQQLFSREKNSHGKSFWLRANRARAWAARAAHNQNFYFPTPQIWKAPACKQHPAIPHPLNHKVGLHKSFCCLPEAIALLPAGIKANIYPVYSKLYTL